MRDIVDSNPARVEIIFQTISTHSSYLTCPGLSIKWTGWRLVTGSGTVCMGDPWKQGCTNTRVHVTIAAASMCLGCLVALKIRTTTTTISNWRCLYVTQLHGSVKHLKSSQVHIQLLKRIPPCMFKASWLCTCAISYTCRSLLGPNQPVHQEDWDFDFLITCLKAFSGR